MRKVPGRFITLEGGEGAGKSTQLALLAAALNRRGIEVVTTREPGGSPGAEDIRALLLTGEHERWTARAEMLLLAAARNDHLSKLILPALARGAWVICDRFIDSTRAYQGSAGGLHDEEIMAVHRIACAGIMPDRTFYLKLPAHVALARARARDGNKNDRFGSRDTRYHDRLIDFFDQLLKTESVRVFGVDACGESESITDRLMDALRDWL
ncbi:MAG: dTMP kinase [Alphaproteobacteria bacterium]|nr:dTMP kinase [Alphaproteobacteria bacterium]MDE2340765.1 dTMP kinase [Alphaproteobacteria bacterium]